MDAKYYRFLYHPVSSGVCFSASVGAAQGKDGIQMLCLGGGAQDAEEEKLPESAVTERLDLLILMDLSPFTVTRAKTLLKTCTVDTLLYPKTQDAPVWEGAAECRGIADHYEVSMPDFVLKLFCSKEKLIVYAGSRGLAPADYECMMNIKPCAPDLPCTLAVDAADLRCEMRCMLCADYTQCKKHNRKNENYFIDGHLLIGTADFFECREALKESLREEWKTIRFIRLPEGGAQESRTKELMQTGTPGYRRYLIGTGETSADLIKAVSVSDAFSTFIFTDQDAGLCISGCYAKR